MTIKKLIDEYYNTVDSSDYDVTDKLKHLRVVIHGYAEKMHAQNDQKGLEMLKLENDVLEIGKSVENGMSPHFRSSKKNEDGTSVEIISPDYTLYGSKEYDYFLKRYNETLNPFLKTEYGLILYINRYLQHFSQREILVDQLIKLAEKYHAKILSSETDAHLYEHNLCARIMDAIVICDRSGEALKERYEKLIKLIEDWFLSWSINHKEFFFFSRFVVKVFTGYQKVAGLLINKQVILEKLDQSIKCSPSENGLSTLFTEEAALFNATYKLKPANEYEIMLGNLHEQEGDRELKRDHIPGAIKSYEDALQYFTNAKDKSSISRVSMKYETNKGKFKMGLISAQTDKDTSKIVAQFINAITEKGSPKQIITCLCGYQLFKKASELEKSAENALNKTTLASFFTTQITDKYGNTLKVYKTDQEKFEFNLLSDLKINYQVTMQIIVPVLFDSLRNKTFSFNDIKDHLNKSWLNEPVEWYRGGVLENIIPLPVIMPGIKNLFSEIEGRILDITYEPSFILCIDNLATKVEQILRYMCKRLSIPTFRYIEINESLLTDEKPMSKLLEDLESKIERDDYILLRYLLNEKGGINIRNRVAHGLLDADEYSVHTAVTLLSLILRLSNYKFTDTEEKNQS